MSEDYSSSIERVKHNLRENFEGIEVYPYSQEITLYFFDFKKEDSMIGSFILYYNYKNDTSKDFFETSKIDDSYKIPKEYWDEELKEILDFHIKTYEITG